MPKRIGHPKLDTSLLPFYQRWKENQKPPAGLWDYLALEGNYDMAAAFSKLFWPDFVEVEGCIFLAERYQKLRPSPGSKEFKRWSRENPRNLEFTANYVNVPYLFADNGIRGIRLVDPETDLYGPEEKIFPDELFVYVAKVLLVCWKHALEEAFPEKKFEFFYHVEDGLTDPKISFWQSE